MLNYIRADRPGAIPYTIAELAYLAGIIDGEGSIYIGNFSSNAKTGALYYQTNMEVTNTDENLIKWLIFTSRNPRSTSISYKYPRSHALLSRK